MASRPPDHFSPSFTPKDPEKAFAESGDGVSGGDAERVDAGVLSAHDWEARPEHPRNWTTSKRWKNAFIIAMTGFLSCVLARLALPTRADRSWGDSTTGSSIFVPATEIIQTEFGDKPHEVVVLTTAMYVLGLGAGPFLFAPVSELYGRQVSQILLSLVMEIGNDPAQRPYGTKALGTLELMLAVRLPTPQA